MDIKEEIGSYEAKSKLPEILRRVASGQRFTITNHGKAIADLVPVQKTNRKKTKLAVQGILNMEKSTIADSELADLKAQGRK